MIVGPWGEVLADGGNGSTSSGARIDTEEIAEARRMVHSLGHDRPFAGPEHAGHRLAAG